MARWFLGPFLGRRRARITLSIGRGSRIRTCGPLLPKQGLQFRLALWRRAQCVRAEILRGLILRYRARLSRACNGRPANQLKILTDVLSSPAPPVAPQPPLAGILCIHEVAFNR